MEKQIYQLINDQLTNDLKDLSSYFNVDYNLALSLLDPTIDTSGRVKKTFTGCHEKRCQARVWNNGYGAQCSRKKTNGSSFCMTHASLKQPRWCKGCFIEFGENRFHNYAWEHLGKITDPPPTCITCRISK
jgi:hypothetical protein